MGRLEHPDDTLCQIFGPLGEKLAAILIAIDDKSIPAPIYSFYEPQARNEADWDNEKEFKMREIIYTFIRRMPPSLMGYTKVKLIWYRAGNIVSEEEIPVQRG